MKSSYNAHCLQSDLDCSADDKISCELYYSKRVSDRVERRLDARDGETRRYVETL